MTTYYVITAGVDPLTKSGAFIFFGVVLGLVFGAYLYFGGRR